MGPRVFAFAELLGTFTFAMSGAIAAKEKRLDLFGVYVVAYVTACGGGMVRDLCLGRTPPAAMSDWRYVAVSAGAATLTLLARHWIERFKRPVAFFDSFGLGFFAVVGAHMTLNLSHNVEAAILLGTMTAVGGGVTRDVLLNRVPVILDREIYALAALVGAAIQVVGQVSGWPVTAVAWIAACTCIAIRLLAMRHSWGLRFQAERRT